MLLFTFIHYTSIFLFFYVHILLFVFAFSHSYARVLSLFGFMFCFILWMFFFVMVGFNHYNYYILAQVYRVFYFQIGMIVGLDFLSTSFIMLSNFILLFCLVIYWNLRYKINSYLFLLFFCFAILINVFASADLLFFYIYFEAVVIPMFLLIGFWGSRNRKVYASYQFFIYTLIGSIFILFAIINFYIDTGSTSFVVILDIVRFDNKAVVLASSLFFGFAFKIPMIPMHTWLPEAHVEAPTPGSVILASLLLKLGCYGLLRVSFGLIGSCIYNEILFIVLTWSFIGFTYASMTALVQIDMKKVIAYSSVAHMNFSLFGLFCDSTLGLTGFIVLMFAHAITSGALFISIGVLYDRYKTRIIFYYNSLVLFMPIFSILFFIFSLANFGFPGTWNFPGEFLILVGGFSLNPLLVFLSSFAMVVTLIYSLLLYSRIFYGPYLPYFIRYYSEISRLEFSVLSIFATIAIFCGLFPLVTLIVF